MNKKEIRHYVVCNLSYAATHALIETKLYSKVIVNIVNDFLECKKPKEDLKILIEDLNDCKYLGTFLSCAFVWNETSERHKYWSDMQDKYYNYIIRF